MGIFEGVAGRPGPLCTEVSRSKEKRRRAGCSDEIEDDLGLQDFSHILPQLEDFMDAVYGQNRTLVLNFATQPCWLFGDAENKTQNCSYLKTQMSRSSATCVVIGKTCWIPAEKLWFLTLDDFSPIL
ncbi:unnamed protein product [Cladocopium goreaui]|uniref:Brefeldin A-inhibited guanine nucleotide-exchange protein 2 n=1 Tax=Cladocopium goreaui TaxID=2562237 RepID=A0A9P1CW05_9DINO|nr:unnamed protein product [Cladocopium goreaui]